MMRKAAAVLTAICCLVANQALALGLGSLTLESSLNQPLRARIEIVDLGGVSPADITVQMAAQQEFQRFDLERTNFLTSINFEIERSANGVYVVLTSSQAVREPYLSFILDTRWPSGRILSEHTVLLDLPVFSDGRSVAEPINQPVSPAVEPQQGVVERQTAAPAPASTTEQAAAPTEEEPSAEPAPVAAATRSETVISDAPQRGDTLEIQESDTLWEIAMRVRPGSSVSIQQTMLAIQRMNPDAFVNGNINRLQAGATLQIPDLSDIQSINQQQAVSEVSRQNQQADLNVEPLTAPSTGPRTSPNAGQGQLRVLTAEDAEPAGNGGRAAVEAENSELDSRIQALENQLALQEEEADRVRVQQADLLSRLDDLDEQIASAMEIIRLQDQQLAQLQGSLAEAAEQAATQQQTAAQTAPPAETRTLPAQQPPPSFLDSILRVLSNSSMVLGIVVVLVVLLMVMLLMRRNRTVTDEGLEADFNDRLEPDSTGDNLPGGQNLDRDHPDQEPDHDEDLAGVAALAGAGLAGAALGGYEDSEYDDRLDDLTDDDDGETDDAGDWEPVADQQIDADEVAADHTEYGMAEEDEADEETGVDVAELDDDPETALDEADEVDEAIDFELDSDDTRAESDQDDVEVLDFDIDDFLDDEDELADSSADEEEADAGEFSSDVDFELDTDAEEEGGDSDTAHHGSIEFTPGTATDAADEMDLETDTDTEEENTGSDAVETLDFDLSSSGIDDFDSENADELIEAESAGAAETEFDSVDFTPAAEDGLTAPGPDRSQADEQESDDGDAVEFTGNDAADLTGNDDSAGTVEEGEQEIDSIDFDADHDDAKSVGDIELDLDSEEARPEQHIEIELEEDSEPESSSTDEVMVDLADDEDEGSDDDSQAGKEASSREAKDAEITGINLAESAANDQAEDDGAVNGAKAGNGADHGAAAQYKDDEEEQPDAAIALAELDFLSADKDALADGAEEELDFLSDDDEAATKLDLAYAYQKMGDVDGAKEILEEVINEGNDAQISEARNLMQALQK